MKQPQKIAVYFVMALFFIMITAGGCSVAKKPEPSPTVPSPQASPVPQSQNKTLPVRNMPTNNKELNRISKMLAAEAAKVSGVKGSTVVISGNTAYVGVDIANEAEKSRTDRIKKEVARVVKVKEDRLANVMVSTDADIITRLKRISTGLSKGQPLSAFNREMAEIARRMSPNTPTTPTKPGTSPRTTP
ncbi:sporulation lipoprotein, YhcN/YlaJ family [Desulfofarcimen acetoxidans DSM 771]|uniref:Sporulation lipoprotein, YhcN/YlaJ family n=1 Tax=Desulfofarcimen acetoxidans (strain ATCC 49208 / DSM 771 / KCTC 5769 / VKM B-1644 / 5575) TaxID=485916 RepID=C8W0G6_DESAS|nr:YhcN/YlaJ family sporulation lipoprotein [Desulfofarcimen acetoxidans]ACV63221.1 sporulation lipoprotein, YhcN/YlaJ family [Desulfofarcimen acetoxidans DSM 771]